MFTVKLGNNQTFIASAIDERYNPKTNYNSNANYSLTFEINPAEKELKSYVEMLSAPTALNSIEISVDGETINTYTNYGVIAEASLRFLSTGQKSAVIRIEQPIAAE